MGNELTDAEILRDIFQSMEQIAKSIFANDPPGIAEGNTYRSFAHERPRECKEYWPFFYELPQIIEKIKDYCSVDIEEKINDIIAAIAKDSAKPTKRELAESLLIVLRMHG